MEDKTPLYMVIIVGIVAVVGLIIVLSNGSSTGAANQVSDNSDAGSITGNVAAFDGGSNSGLSLNIFGKVFFGLFLVGIVAYLYFRYEE
jgi:hypothetical protein